MRNFIALSLAITTSLAAPAVLARPDGQGGSPAQGADDRFFLFSSPQTPLGPLVQTAWEGAQGFAATVSADDSRRRLGQAYPRLFVGAAVELGGLETDLKSGVDAHYESKYADAEKRLAAAVAFAVADPSALAEAPAALATRLADGVAIRYRNALKMKADKAKALGELERFIRSFPTLAITVDDHPPEIAEEWKKARARVLADAGSLTIGVHPVEFERAGRGCEVLVNGGSAGKVSGSPVSLPRGRFFVQVRCDEGASWLQSVTVSATPASLTIPVRAMNAARGNPETGGLVLVAASDDDAAALVTAVSGASGFKGAVVVRAGKDKLELGRQDAGALTPSTEAVARLKGGAVESWKAVGVSAPEADRATSSGGGFGPWPWITGGAGLAVLLGVGVGLNLAYESERTSGADADAATLDSLKSASLAGYVGGGALVATGIALLLLDDKADAPASTAVSANGRGLMVRF